jgi:hypothetical protein
LRKRLHLHSGVPNIYLNEKNKQSDEPWRGLLSCIKSNDNGTSVIGNKSLISPRAWLTKTLKRIRSRTDGR